MVSTHRKAVWQILFSDTKAIYLTNTAGEGKSNYSDRPLNTIKLTLTQGLVCGEQDIQEHVASSSFSNWLLLPTAIFSFLILYSNLSQSCRTVRCLDQRLGLQVSIYMKLHTFLACCCPTQGSRVWDRLMIATGTACLPTLGVPAWVSSFCHCSCRRFHVKLPPTASLAEMITDLITASSMVIFCVMHHTATFPIYLHFCTIRGKRSAVFQTQHILKD